MYNIVCNLKFFVCLEFFNDEEEVNNILKVIDLFEMKRCGRRVKGFENDVWYKYCVGIVKKGVKVKVCFVLLWGCKILIYLYSNLRLILFYVKDGFVYKMSLSVVLSFVFVIKKLEMMKV